jgi:hypothetical protein
MNFNLIMLIFVPIKLILFADEFIPQIFIHPLKNVYL